MAEDPNFNYANTREAQEANYRHAADLEALKHKYETERQKTGHKHAFRVAVLTAIAGCLGVVAAAAITLFGTFWTAKHNNPNTTVKVDGLAGFGNGLLGLAKAVSHLTLTPAPPDQHPQGPESNQSQPTANPQSTPSSQPTPSPDLDVARVSGAHCVLSDSAVWAVSTDDAIPLKDRSGNYYSIDVRLKNLSPKTLYLTHYNDTVI